jgi:thioredoxin reductase
MTRVAIIGAGPYGLSVAAHLRSRGVPYRILGGPLDTWRRHMPAGMTLKSDGFASSLSAPGEGGTLAAYCAERGIPYHDTDVPVPLDVFNEYALDFQQRFVPDVDDRQVHGLERSDGRFTLTLADGEMFAADFVVAAVGITHFAFVPEELSHLRPPLVSHSSEHHDLAALEGRDVTVIGGGSSAVDLAVLAHEAGATTSLIARRASLRFNSEAIPGSRTRWQRARHPSSGLGPGWRSWLCENVPGMFRVLPSRARLVIIGRHLGPKSAWHMRARLESGVAVSLGETVEHAEEEHGRVRLQLRDAAGGRREHVTDLVVAATGYRPDVRRLTFLADDIRESILTHAGMPIVSRRFESSVAGLYFVGLPAVYSFGPLMRFMVGAEYAAPVVARRLAQGARRSDDSVRAMATA